MKSKIFILAITIQIVIIIVLLLQIKQKRSNTLGISINPINSKTIQKTPSGGLKYFYEPKANTIVERREEWLPDVPKYTINGDSLNERFNYDIKKKERSFRIITLGDSFTFGSNVSTENNWTEILEDRLNNEKLCSIVKKYEVINLGVGGYDTAYEVERYKIRGQKYNPDLIIWFVTDLHRITNEFIALTKEMNINENENQKKGIFYEAWRRAKVKVIDQYGEKGLINYQIDKLKEFREKYFKHNPMLFISSWTQLVQGLGGENIYFNDTKVWADKTSLLPDGHFNNKGHIIFTQAVIEALDKNKLLPCN